MYENHRFLILLRDYLKWFNKLLYYVFNTGKDAITKFSEHGKKEVDMCIVFLKINCVLASS